MILGTNGEVLDGRYAYFESLLNENYERKSEIDCLGMGGVIGVRVEKYKEMIKSEVLRALKKIKCGKSPGLDGITAELLKNGGDCVVKWLIRLFSVCWGQGMAGGMYCVPLHKGKRSKRKCTNYRGKVYLAYLENF